MLSKLSVKKPYTVVVAVILVMLLGVVSFTDMTVDLLPSMNLPYAVVITAYPGASPEEVEAAVTKPVEQTMATISNIKKVNSTSQENASTVILEFEQTANMDSVTIEMRESLDQISGYWPETVANPIIMKLNPSMLPIMVAAVSGAEGDLAAQDKIKEQVIPDIESIEGVASVTVSGNIEETVEVKINENKVANLNGTVRAQLDKKFEEASSALATAKAQVASGKAALESGKSEASAQLGQAETEISKKNNELLQAQLEVKAGLSEIALGEVVIDAQITILQLPYTVLVEQRAELQALKKSEDKIRKEYAELSEEIANNPPGTQAQIERQGVLLAQISILDSYDATLVTLNAELTNMEASLSEAKGKRAQLDAAKKMLLDLQTQLAQGSITLAEVRGQMTSAQMLAAIEISSGGAQLAVGEAAIAEKEAEFEEAKDGAYSAGNLNTIIDAEMVNMLITAQNFNMPAGYIKEEKVDYLVRVGDRIKDIAELKNMILIDMDGIDPIKLSDVADIAKVNNASETYAKLNGESGILLSIQKQTGYSTGDVSKRILKEFEQISSEDKGIEFTTLMDQGIYIDLIVNSVLNNMLFGGIFAILVLLLFLKSFRPTLVIACSIPISLLAAIVMMYFSGVTLNIISLSGLALGVGMLVDNSIVVIENIYRMRNEEGASARKAAIEGAKQVAGAIMASTLTTICVFAPIVFAKGITRQLFVDMGLTIAYSLIASLLVALTLVPMMSAGLLKKTKEKESKLFTKIQTAYAKSLETVLKVKPLVLILSLVLLVGSGMLALQNGTAFMPSMESTELGLVLETENGTPLEETGEIADQVIEKLLKIDDIEDIGAIASSGSMFGGASKGNRIEISAILKEDKKRTGEELKKKIEEDTKDLKGELTISTSNMDMSALGSSGVVVQIKGADLDTLREIAKEISVKIEKVKGTRNVSDGMEETTAEMRIVVDKAKASKHSLTVAQVYKELATKLAETRTTSKLTTTTEDYDIFVVEQKNEELSRTDLQNINITATKMDGTTEEVPLRDIAVFVEGEGLQSISRDAQSRNINVTSEIKDGENIGIVSNRVKDALSDYTPPKGYEVKMTGEDETIMESMVELFKMLALAVVFMYLIMVAQFQSLRSPFIIMFTIPLAFTGGLFSLFIAGLPISVIAMVGFIMLSGIIVNNGIVFVDYTNQLISEGMEKRKALIEAGRTRLRPIIMTALTTILGLSTMAMGLGMGADMTQPMAIVTVGGLIYGTFLTLYVVPCIFDLFKGKEKARLKTEIEVE